MIRVLVVEDHQQVRQAICDLLREHCDVVGELDNAEAIPASVSHLYPHVLLLDVSLPGRSGLQVLPKLRSEFPRLGIVIVTNHAELAYRATASERGADGFVLKEALSQELWPTIRSAYSSRLDSNAIDKACSA